MRGGRVCAWGSLALSAGFAFLGAKVQLGDAGFSDDTPFVLVSLAWGGIGVLLASRLPSHPIGWLFCSFGVLGTSSYLAQVYAENHPPGRATRLHEIAGWYETWAGDWLPPLVVVLLLLLFPTGRFETLFERTVAVVASVAFSAAAVGSALAPGPLPRQSFDNPFGSQDLEGLSEALTGMSGVLLPIVLLSSIGSLIRRSRRSSGDEREQIKWFVFASGVMVLSVVLATGVSALGVEGGDWFGVGLFFSGLLGVAVATAIAVLKHRLYDLDLVINRAIVYAILTAVLTAFYFGTVVLFQQIAGTLTRESDVAVAGSTLLVAAAFRPLRARIQDFIDHRFYRSKYNALETLERFSAHLRDQVHLDSLSQELVTVVATTMQPQHASLWLRGERLP